MRVYTLRRIVALVIGAVDAVVRLNLIMGTESVIPVSVINGASLVFVVCAPLLLLLLALETKKFDLDAIVSRLVDIEVSYLVPAIIVVATLGIYYEVGEALFPWLFYELYPVAFFTAVVSLVAMFFGVLLRKVINRL